MPHSQSIQSTQFKPVKDTFYKDPHDNKAFYKDSHDKDAFYNHPYYKDAFY